MYIDSHAHLFSDDLINDIDDILRRAKENNVTKIIVPATDVATAHKVLELCNKYEMIYGAAGVHPHDAAKTEPGYLEELRKLLKHPKMVAVGEIGLDYYYDFSPKEKQIDVFRQQLDLAVELNLPVIIHNRDSTEDMMNIIRSYCGKGLRAQFHCFNAGLEEARELVSMNHFISFTGNITFKKADELRAIASKLSLEHLLIETDSPYMTPVPFRGKRNEPMHTVKVAETLASLHNMSAEDIGRITTYNVFRLFGIGEKPGVSYTYKIGSALYINVTTRCNADCTFCKRNTDPVISGYNLGMKKGEEPAAETYIKEIGNPADYSEIVFCGYGEPTIRWNEIKKIAEYVKSNGGKTRINTNGHGSYINKRDIASEMQGLIDTVSISLNSYNAAEYAKIMQVNPKMFDEMLSFVHEAKKYVPDVTVTVVSSNEENVREAQKFAESINGVKFRVREFF